MLLQILKIIAGIATVLTGIVSLFWPRRVLDFTGLQVRGGRGITEIRTILGALFVGLGAAVLVINSSESFLILGITYLVMAVVRALSIVVDRSAVSSNIISVVVEVVLGIILII